jgi:hypothetical protein
VLAIALLVGAAVAGRWYLRRGPPQAPPPPAAAPVEPAPPPPGPAEPEPEPAVEPRTVRERLEAASSDPLFRRGVAADDPIRRWAVVTDNLAEGVSPREQLPFLAPKGPFQVVRRDGRAFVAPASYARYDAFADAVASVDARALATAYRAARGVVEGAYRALGYPGASLDQVTARALRRIAGAPVRDGEVEVVDEKGVYTFADPRLEGLGAVEKHLLRMGPRNTRAIQAKARELLEALRLPAEPERRR